jgi:hypothetical protein
MRFCAVPGKLGSHFLGREYRVLKCSEHQVFKTQVCAPGVDGTFNWADRGMNDRPYGLEQDVPSLIPVERITRN